MRAWKRNGYTVEEKEFDYDLHCFAVVQKGKEDQTITPGSIEDMNSIITDLDNGEDVGGWEDGAGNTIHIAQHGGLRPGAGRKPTGRKKLIVYVTDEEAVAIKDLIEKMRKDG